MIDAFYEIVQILKKGISEKEIVEFFIHMENQSIKLKPIGHNKDIRSEYKNEFFDEIYENENGHIIDLRISEETPTQEEVDNMAEYWIELQKTFNKMVEPYFIITGKKPE